MEPDKCFLKLKGSRLKIVILMFTHTSWKSFTAIISLQPTLKPQHGMMDISNHSSNDNIIDDNIPNPPQSFSQNKSVGVTLFNRSGKYRSVSLSPHTLKTTTVENVFTLSSKTTFPFPPDKH